MLFSAKDMIVIEFVAYFLLNEASFTYTLDLCDLCDLED